MVFKNIVLDGKLQKKEETPEPKFNNLRIERHYLDLYVPSFHAISIVMLIFFKSAKLGFQ